MKRLVTLGVVLLGACAPVPPHARGRLMQRTMQPKPALDEAFDDHVHETRESLVGGTAGQGASCGCR